MVLRSQRPHASNTDEVLAHQLIDQAATADLVLGSFGVFRAHVASQVRSDLIFSEAANFLYIIFTVEQIRVDPLSPPFEETAVYFRGGIVANCMRHFCANPQGAQVV